MTDAMTPAQRLEHAATLAQLRAEARAWEILVDALALDERPRAFACRWSPEGAVYLVHRDTYPAAPGWRVTYLVRTGSDLMPTGHTTASTYRRAIVEARAVGADLTREEPIP